MCTLLLNLLVIRVNYLLDLCACMHFSDFTEMFKNLYTQPEKAPSPPPTPKPEKAPSPPPTPKPKPPTTRIPPKKQVKTKAVKAPVNKQAPKRKPPLRRPIRATTSTFRRSRLKIQRDTHQDDNSIKLSNPEQIESTSAVESATEINEVESKSDFESLDSQESRIETPLVDPESLPEASVSTKQTCEESADEEDDIIDIGDPPTPPPTEHLLSVPSTPSATLNHMPFHSPSKSNLLREDSFTSSPNKYFSICSETVVKQSQEVDNNGERNQSRVSHESSTSSAHISGDDDDLISDHDNEQSNNSLTQDLHHTSHQEDTIPGAIQLPQGYVNQPNEDEKQSADTVFGDEDTDIERDDQLIGDDGDDDESRYSDEESGSSREVTDDGESDEDNVDLAVNDEESIDNEKKVIAPLRISKRQVGFSAFCVLCVVILKFLLVIIEISVYFAVREL